MNNEDTKTSIIDFDGDIFLNKHGINSLGLRNEEAEAIYNDLLNQNRFSDGPEGYIFINNVLAVAYQRTKFLQHDLIKKNL